MLCTHLKNIKIGTYTHKTEEPPSRCFGNFPKINKNLKTNVRTLQATQSKVSFLATKFGINKKTPPKKCYPAEKPKNNKNERYTSILTLIVLKDAGKKQYFSDQSQGIRNKQQNRNFKMKLL